MKSGKLFLNLLFILLSALLACPSSALANPSLPDEDNIQLNRSRLLFGYTSLVMNEEPMSANMFMNVNYRTSEFDPFTKPFKVKWALEAGLNGVFPIEHNFGSGVIIPYVKTGPEMSLMKNLFIGGSVGLAAVFYGYFGVAPYAGINSYYLLPLNRDLFVEFEFGCHSTFVAQNIPYLFYFATGIAIK